MVTEDTRAAVAARRNPANHGEGSAGPEEFGKEYWEERHRGHLAGHGGGPNTQLVAEAADLTPGTALDAGCGRGADAVWLASRGWRVTAVDISGTALRHAREHAETLGPEVASRIDWVEADLAEWTPPENRFDLVSTHYVHPATSRAALFARLAAAVAPGGTLLVVGHHPSDPHAGGAHGPAPETCFTAEEVAAGLDPGRWDVAVAEARTRSVLGPHGHETTLHDAVLRSRKRP
nr:class I SAM-dependent methyltransferase [Rhizohabitans arisaemae]